MYLNPCTGWGNIQGDGGWLEKSAEMFPPPDLRLLAGNPSPLEEGNGVVTLGSTPVNPQPAFIVETWVVNMQ